MNNKIKQVVSENQIQSIIDHIVSEMETLRKHNSRENKCKKPAKKKVQSEIIGIGFTTPSDKNLMIKYDSALSGCTCLLLDVNKCFEKPVTPKSQEPMGYISFVIINENNYKICYNGKEYDLV